MIEIHTVEQGTDEWQKLRAGKFTGSNAHKLLKFGALDYSLTETGKFRGNFWTKRGHILEDEAIELYETIHRLKVLRPGFVTNTAFPGCGYSPDALLANRTIEVKAFADDKHLRIIGSGAVPFEVLAQCHFGMLICDRRLCDLILYNPNLEADKAFKVITIKNRRSVNSNFKRILAGREVAVHAI